MFPTLSNLLTSADVTAEELLLDVISEQLTDYQFWPWFFWPGGSLKNSKINNPFIEDTNTCELSLCEKESRLEMCCDTTLLSRYKKRITVSILDICWKRISAGQSQSNQNVSDIFNHLHEKTFSALAFIKTRERNRSDANAELRLSATPLQSHLSRMLAMKQ